MGVTSQCPLQLVELLKVDLGPNASYSKPPSELATLFPLLVGIAEIIEPTPTPPSKAAPVPAQFTAAVYVTRMPVSSDVNVAEPMAAPRKPENMYRPAVNAPVSHIALDRALPVMMPLPGGAAAPGTAAFVLTKF